jgi:hypothetical protein
MGELALACVQRFGYAAAATVVAAWEARTGASLLVVAAGGCLPAVSAVGHGTAVASVGRAGPFSPATSGGWVDHAAATIVSDARSGSPASVTPVPGPPAVRSASAAGSTASGFHANLLAYLG